MACGKEDAKWTREETRFFISIYKNYPLLYNAMHPDHLKIDKRTEALSKILSEVEEIKPGVTISMIKRKIKVLQQQLSLERKRMSMCCRSDNDDPVKPRLWCYDDIQFLKEASDLKAASAVKSNTDPTAINNILGCDLDEFGTNLLQGKNKKRTRLDVNIEKLHQSAIKSLKIVASLLNASKTESPESQSKVDAFCNYLSTELKELKEESFNNVTMEIMQAVNKAKLNEKKVLTERDQQQNVNIQQFPKRRLVTLEPVSSSPIPQYSTRLIGSPVLLPQRYVSSSSSFNCNSMQGPQSISPQSTLQPTADIVIKTEFD